jgi:uncharacterized membrane-anchored protein YitT (DUF2179 family)
MDKVAKYFRKIKYVHGATVYDATGTRRNNSFKKLSTICSIVEAPKIIAVIKELDPNTFFTATKVAGIEG